MGIHQLPVGFADASLYVRSPLREQGLLQSGSNELAGVLQCNATSCEASSCEPDDIWQKLVCTTSKALCAEASIIELTTAGQVHLTTCPAQLDALFDAVQDSHAVLGLGTPETTRSQMRSGLHLPAGPVFGPSFFSSLYCRRLPLTVTTFSRKNNSHDRFLALYATRRWPSHTG